MSGLLEELRAALPEQYQVEAEIGRGGMATVFAAEDVKHGRRVAIKVLTPELSTSVGAERFLREIQVSARLSHPHILPVFDSGAASGLLYYVMPFVEGESLRARLVREQQFSIEDAITIACEIADALSYAHGMGIVHRDIKPENVLLHGGHAVVADFGIARMLYEADDGGRLTSTGSSIGTATYMSPEQFSGLNVDGRSDQYSLACVLYEMLVGQVPFTGPNAMAIMARHTMEAVPSIRVVRPTVPDELEGVIMRALEKVPADRFATMQQFKDAILEGAAGSSFAPRLTRATMGHRASMYAEVPRRRRSTLVLGAILMVLLAGGTLAGRYYWVQRMQEQSDVATQGRQGALGLDPNRVAVLYFDDDSRNHTLAYLADGLTESLIGDLSRVQPLDVISENGVSPYRGAAIALDSVARTLRAGTLVRGSVEDAGDRVRVTVRLYDGNSGAEWKRAAFEQPKANALAARDSLGEQVSILLRTWLGKEIALRDERAGTRNTEAWSAVQLGERAEKDAQLLLRSDSAAASARRVAEAESLFTLAARLDPRWASPAVRSARLFIWRTRITTRDALLRRQLIDSGLARAETALVRDPQSAEAFEQRGTLRYMLYLYGLVPDPAEAATVLRGSETDLRRATDLSPRLASAWSTLSAVLYQQQNKTEANFAAHKAYEADAYLASAPAIIWRLYATSYDLKQFVAATQWCQLGHQRYPDDPQFVACRLWLMTTNYQRPDVPDAWRTFAELERLTPKLEWADGRRSYYQMLVAVPIARAGLADSANRVIERARPAAGEDPGGELLGHEALVRTLIGDKEEALRLLRVYVTSHPEHREGLVTANTWWWESLQDDPRFKRLVAAGR